MVSRVMPACALYLDGHREKGFSFGKVAVRTYEHCLLKVLRVRFRIITRVTSTGTSSHVIRVRKTILRVSDAEGDNGRHCTSYAQDGDRNHAGNLIHKSDHQILAVRTV